MSVPVRPVGVLARRSDHANVMCTKLQVVDHYEKPRNVGSFDKKDLDVGTGLVGAPACGDVMKLQIRVCEVYSLELQVQESVDLPAILCNPSCCLLYLGGQLPIYGIILGVCCRSMRLETLWTHASRHLAVALQLHPAVWPPSG